MVELPPKKRLLDKLNYKAYPSQQLVLIGMAGFIFMIGLVASVLTMLTNHTATAQVSALAKHATNAPATTDAAAATGQANSAPSTVRPTARAVGRYAVAPDLARYLKIPKLGVNSRVLQVGITNDGALATPSNVFDTAWYTGSAKPGQPGATLIDGHVSSWTTHGVFYGI